jgi:hypothetical protein
MQGKPCYIALELTRTNGAGVVSGEQLGNTLPTIAPINQNDQFGIKKNRDRGTSAEDMEVMNIH